MKRLGAALLCGLMAVAAAGQSRSPAAMGGNMERRETGSVRGPSGTVEHYRIRLLPVDAFPSLPAAVAAQLAGRGCMIPQSFEAQQPENVIHGAFRAAGSADWAALCSVSGTTTLYVFFSGKYGSPDPVRSQPDTEWLGAEPGSAVYGSAWGISTESLAELHESQAIQAGFPLDHDAIEDSHLEQSVSIRYFHRGKWVVLLSNEFY